MQIHLEIQNTDLKQNADSSGNNSPFTSGVKLRVRDILLCFWSNPSILKNDIHRWTEVLKTQAASQKVQSIENCKLLKTRAGKRCFVFNPIFNFDKIISGWKISLQNRDTLLLFFGGRLIISNWATQDPARDDNGQCGFKLPHIVNTTCTCSPRPKAKHIVFPVQKRRNLERDREQNWTSFQKKCILLV